jgi:hypothetical protein
MLSACRLGSLSALKSDYAAVDERTQCGRFVEPPTAPGAAAPARVLRVFGVTFSALMARAGLNRASSLTKAGFAAKVRLSSIAAFARRGLEEVKSGPAFLDAPRRDFVLSQPIDLIVRGAWSPLVKT